MGEELSGPLLLLHVGGGSGGPVHHSAQVVEDVGCLEVLPARGAMAGPPGWLGDLGLGT